MIGNFIKKLRIKNKLSQEYIADKMGLARPTYSAIEKGVKSLTLDEAKELAKLFDISFEQLVNEKDSSPNITVTKSEKKEEKNTDLRISIPQKNFEKFREVLLYILSNVGAKPNVGQTVIYKLLYFIDFDYYEKYEEQLIGATYLKNHYGPTPVEFKMLIEDMIIKNELIEVNNKSFGYKQTKYLAVRLPNLSKLISAQELQHINEVLARLSDKNAAELSDYSHQDVPWIVTEEQKPIDYESVFYRTPKTSLRNYGENNL